MRPQHPWHFEPDKSSERQAERKPNGCYFIKEKIINVQSKKVIYLKSMK